MRRAIRFIRAGILSAVLAGCSTADHGTFVTHTYIDRPDSQKGEKLGHVTAESSQTWFLYFFPWGEQPSTHQAILMAKEKQDGTSYLGDVSIDHKTLWRIGYLKQIITVEGDAYR